MNILQLTCHFSPNVGGVETHLDDLVAELIRKEHKVFVLTYRPLTSDAKWTIFENKKDLTIFRIPWIKGYFYKLVKSPVVEFLYLFPGLFIILPFILLFKKIDIIHSHGLVAGFVGLFWGKIYDIKTVVSTHSVYEFPSGSKTLRVGDSSGQRPFFLRVGDLLYKNFARWMFNSTDKILTLSKQSKNELVKLGVTEKKITVFTYWVDLDRFKPVSSKLKAKSLMGWKYKFVVLFVGRLVEEKGILVLLEATQKWNKNIKLVVIGTGPLEESIKYQVSSIKNVKYIGAINNNDLPKYYNAADVTIVPSIHEEGFGRVILESLACGTPVIGSNRGAISEAMDETVGKLINVNVVNIVKSVNEFYQKVKILIKLTKNSRRYAEKQFSYNNISQITSTYYDQK